MHSIGNLGVLESKETVSNSYKTIDFGYYIIYSLLTVLLIAVINPIVATAFGADKVLPLSSTLIICTLFYFNNIKILFNSFKAALGIYYYDRTRSIVSPIFNLLVSFILGRVWGFNGILAGTILTFFLIDLWAEPLIIFHKGFEKSVRKYLMTILGHLIITAIIAIITHYICTYLPKIGIIAIISRGLVALLTTIPIIYIVFRKHRNFKQTVLMLKKIILKK